MSEEVVLSFEAICRGTDAETHLEDGHDVTGGEWVEGGLRLEFEPASEE